MRPLLHGVWISSMGSQPAKRHQIIEMVQRHAARWIKSDYSYNSSVSTMLTEL